MVSVAPGAARCRALVEDLQQSSLLHPTAPGELLQVGVTDDRVGDPPEGRQDTVDEALPAFGSPNIDPRRVEVDQIRQDRVRRSRGFAPQVRVLPDDLVGILAVRKPDDADIGQAEPAVGLDLGDQRVQLGDPKRAGALPGGIDVVGEGDLLRVAGEERDLAGRQRRPQRGYNGVEAGLVGHQGVGVALDDDGLPALADGRLRAVDQVQRPALVEQRRRGRIQVFGAMVRLIAIGDEVAATQAHGISVLVADREDDPGPEAVDRTTAPG